MTARTGTQLKNEWGHTDPFDQNVNLIDSVAIDGDAASFAIGSQANTAGSGFDLADETAAFRVYADDGGTSQTGNLRAAMSRLLLTLDNAVGVSYRSYIGQVKINDGIDISSVNSVLAGLMGYLEFAGDSTQNGQVAAGEFTIEGAGDITVGASGWLAGIAARLNMASGKTVGAQTAGVYVNTTGTAGDTWPYGVYVKGADVGFYVNANCSLALQVGELSSTAQTGLTLSATTPSAVDVFSDDGDSVLGNENYFGIRSRTMLFQSATGVSIFGVRGQIKSADAVDFGPGVYAGVQGYQELYGDTSIQSGAKWYAVDASIDVPTGKTLTVDVGGIVAGFHAELTGLGTVTSSGLLIGLKVDEAIAVGTWDYGVYIAASASAAGIYVGTCTGTGIDFPAGSTYGKALAYGEFGTPIVYDTDEPFEIHGRLGSATEQKPLMRVRNSAPASTNMTTGAVTALQAQAYGTDTSDIGGLEALQAHVGIKATCEIIADTGTIPNMRAGFFKIEDGGNDLTLTGDAAVLCLGTQFNAGTTLTGVCDWMFLAKEGTLTGAGGVPDAFVRVYDGTGGGWANFLFDVPASLPYSAANSGGTQSGKMAINVGGATKYIQCYSD